MKFIISPAKKMKVDTDTLPVSGLPVFLKETGLLKERIQSLSPEEAQRLWGCNDKLAKLNYERFRDMDLKRRLTPAVLAYEGLQYQHLAPSVLTEEALSYLEGHLRILSGFYGILSPFDGVVPYRLEMQARLAVEGAADLYEFWGDKLYRALFADGETVVNLASREYSRAVERYLEPGDAFLTVDFKELSGGKLRTKATMAKMARGEMARFLAEIRAEDPEAIKGFRGLGYSFREELSREDRMVFVREETERQRGMQSAVMKERS